MKVFQSLTADGVWRTALGALNSVGESQPSRGGPTRELLHVALCVENPRQRWVLSREPAINPAFSIVELVWVMTGRRDSALPNFWNPALSKFAGDDCTYHGAYGYRLRHRFGMDQLR